MSYDLLVRGAPRLLDRTTWTRAVSELGADLELSPGLASVHDDWVPAALRVQRADLYPGAEDAMRAGALAVGFELRAAPGAGDPIAHGEAHRAALAAKLRRLEELNAPEVLLQHARRELENAGRGEAEITFRLPAGSSRACYAAVVLAAAAYALASDAVLLDPQAGVELRGDALRIALPSMLEKATREASEALEPFTGWE